MVAFYGVVPDGPGGTLATVTEYMVNGSLKQVLHKKERLRYDNVNSYTLIKYSFRFTICLWLDFQVPISVLTKYFETFDCFLQNN